MSLESATYIHQLDASNPSGADRLKDGDDHLRMIKAALKATFPGIAGPLSASVTHDFLNGLALATMPLGAIIMWTGAASAVPAGWAICDGRTVSKSAGGGTVTTPDMRDRVPVGVSSTHGVNTTYGQFTSTITTGSAGAHLHTAVVTPAGSHNHGGASGDHVLTIAELPAHAHLAAAATNAALATLSASNSVIALSTGGGEVAYGLAGTATPANVGVTSSAGSNQAHSHVIPTDGAHSHAITIQTAGDHSHSATIDATQPSYAVYFLMRI